jgi:hypothetical protein
MRYFYTISANRFHEEVQPALAASWASKSFIPAQILCRNLSLDTRKLWPHVNDSAGEPLVQRVAEGMAFRPDVWKLLVAEVLLYSAVELPELETPILSLSAVFGQVLVDKRTDFGPLQQAIQGSQDLIFGSGYYRPEHAGWNDHNDVARLATWLNSIQPSSWSLELLCEVPGAEREEELAYIREWFPELTAAYNRAATTDLIVVCEEI